MDPTDPDPQHCAPRYIMNLSVAKALTANTFEQQVAKTVFWQDITYIKLSVAIAVTATIY
jgi:hypothetical protein